MESYEFQSFDPMEGVVSKQSIDRVSGVRMRAELVVGGADVSVGDMLEWRVGDVVVLDGVYGESMEMRANGTCVGRGELVVLDDNTLGIRILDLGK